MTLRHPIVKLLPKKAAPLFGRHPWLFPAAIDKIDREPEAGEVVKVVSADREFVGWGLYNPASLIRVRMLSWNEAEPIDDQLLDRRIRRAIALRQADPAFADPTGGCRLIYGEADELSGLICDRYADVAVMQWTSRALADRREVCERSLRSAVAVSTVIHRFDEAIAEKEGATEIARLFAQAESPPSCVIVENGCRFEVDFEIGQKTGYFLDQRENRKALCRYVSGKSILDLFCYTGGFGVTAKKLGGAKSVLGVEVSGQAIAAAQRNADRNDVDVEFRREEVGPFLDRAASSAGERFDVVVCDPPKFAKSNRDLSAALKGYEYLNRQAMRVVKPGGLLLTCSCSGAVSLERFVETLAEAARRVGRPTQIVEIKGQPADHPISLFCRESEYLKSIFLRIVE